jgi:flagellar hook-basal body complex protein FliE
MDLRLSPVSTSMPSRVGVLPRASTTATPDAKSAGFSGALKGALTEVSNAQNNATELQKQVQLENPSVSLEETMVAIQKAQIGFQATLHVRNRMVQAYSDIMNMQV